MSDRTHTSPIWHAFSFLREYRGDTHLAVLVSNGIDPCECHLVLAAAAVGGCECHRFMRDVGITVDVETPPSVPPTLHPRRAAPRMVRLSNVLPICWRSR
ncbi:helix-turn-helix domain-containing protein [Nocardia cerradoensis]|uniref:helix-turn-helix domain-containing protein n=1 Tax=Nocardia cerradoensis TaxID=85688 RepID=UPI003F6ADEAF